MQCPLCGTDMERDDAGHACPQCSFAGDTACVEAVRAMKARPGKIVAAIEHAWQVRCEDYVPWPDGEPGVETPHDATAQHVFDLLHTAAVNEAIDEVDEESRHD